MTLLNRAGHDMMETRVRERFCFWLDVRDDYQWMVSEVVKDLKKKRQFSSTVRDGIMLVTSLRAGRLDVLIELFPWVVRELEQGRAIPQLAEPAAPRPLATLQPVAPLPDDDSGLLTITKADVAESKASQNFLASAFGLQD